MVLGKEFLFTSITTHSYKWIHSEMCIIHETIAIVKIINKPTTLKAFVNLPNPPCLLLLCLQAMTDQLCVQRN